MDIHRKLISITMEKARKKKKVEEAKPPAYRPSKSDPRDMLSANRMDLALHWRDTANHRLAAPLPDYHYLINQRDLPATAESIWDLDIDGWKNMLEPLLCGTRDDNSPLAVLRQHEATIVRDICSYIRHEFAGHVKMTVPASLVGNLEYGEDNVYAQFDEDRVWPCVKDDVAATSHRFDDGFVAFARCGQVEFPAPADRNVNMMPFVFGDKESLPDDLKCYFPLIEQCPYLKDDLGKVGYLTVHESYIDAGKAQRREGLHIESPGVSFPNDENAPSFAPGVEEEPDNWGKGFFLGPDRYDGGIFFASSVQDTSKVWNALVDNRVSGIVDDMVHASTCVD